MLSPNARNFVRLIRGGAVTVTRKVHELARCRASVAVHVTVVAPTANVDWLAGVQATCTGDSPPVVVAVPYDTGTDVPVGDATVIGEGQLI
jgi:hypothetical protein